MTKESQFGLRIRTLAFFVLQISSHLNDAEVMAYLQTIQQYYPEVFAHIWCIAGASGQSIAGRYAAYAHLNEHEDQNSQTQSDD